MLSPKWHFILAKYIASRCLSILWPKFTTVLISFWQNMEISGKTRQPDYHNNHPFGIVCIKYLPFS